MRGTNNLLYSRIAGITYVGKVKPSHMDRLIKISYKGYVCVALQKINAPNYFFQIFMENLFKLSPITNGFLYSHRNVSLFSQFSLRKISLTKHEILSITQKKKIASLLFMFFPEKARCTNVP